MVTLFCRLGNETMKLDVSNDLYRQLNRLSFKRGKSLQELVQEAFVKYGVSQSAIWRYLKTIPSETTR